MHELDLIRAATEDVAAARVLLQERTEALDAIIQTALDHGISMDDVTEASKTSLTENKQDSGRQQSALVA